MDIASDMAHNKLVDKIAGGLTVKQRLAEFSDSENGSTAPREKQEA